jgi:hypothetical protein
MSALLLLPRLRYLARRAGWPALAGVALLAAAAALDLGPLTQARDKLSELRASIIAARTQRNAPQRASTDAASLLAALPGRDTLESTLAAIHQTAAAQGLATRGGEYAMRKEAGGDMLRYEITLPLKTAYAPLRAWLGELATQQPALAIDELSLHRLGGEQDQLEGRLRLVLFLRARPALPAPETAVAPAPTLPTLAYAASAGDLFAIRSWQPPPPPPAPPPKPTAPPLPFQYAGKLIEEQGIRVFLTQGNTITLVKQGDQLGNYDVERVTPSSVVLIYRPLRETQTLNFGGSID